MSLRQEWLEGIRDGRAGGMRSEGNRGSAYYSLVETQALALRWEVLIHRSLALKLL